jgi:hypothetical protein
VGHEVLLVGARYLDSSTPRREVFTHQEHSFRVVTQAQPTCPGRRCSQARASARQLVEIGAQLGQPRSASAVQQFRPQTRTSCHAPASVIAVVLKGVVAMSSVPGIVALWAETLIESRCCGVAG